MTKLLSLEELKKNSSGNSVKKQNAYKGSTPLLSLDELKNNEGPGVETASIGNTVEAYNKYKQAKVAGGTANPIISTSPSVGTNQNVAPSAERVAGRQTSYFDQMMQNKQKAEQMKANTKPSVRATAQDVKDALFGKAMDYGTVNPRISASEINTKYNSMTDDEASVYMTLRNQGRQAEADEYLKAVEYEINERNMNRTKERAKEIGSDGVVAPLLYGAALSIPSSAGILYNAWQDAKGEATDMNHGAYGGSAAFNALYDAYVNGVNGEESPQWKKDLKGTAMTVAQMMGHMPAGMFAPLTMGASAASGASMDALNRGGTTEQSLFGGLAAGAAEGAGSALSLGTMGKIFGKLGSKVSGKGMDRLRNLAKEIRKDKGRAIAIDLLKISGVEGSEEMVTEVMNALTDMAIMGENSNFNLVMEDAMAKGMSEEEAFDYAMKATGQNVLEAGKMGAMAGGLMGGLGMGVNAVTGRNIIPNNEEAIERARVQYEAATRQPDVPDTNVGETEQLNRTTPQNPVTVHETAISEELDNSPAEMRTQPTEAQTRLDDELEGFGERFYGEKGKEAFLKTAREKGNMDHTSAFNAYYRAGVAGKSIKEIKQTAYTAVADKVMLNEAYVAGVEDRKAMVREAINGRNRLSGEMGLILDEDVKATDAQMEIAKLYADLGGVRIKIVNEISQEIGSKKFTANGSWNPGEYTVTLALNTDTFIGTANHEMVHYIKTVDKVAFGALRDLVFDLADKIGIDIEAKRAEYKKRNEGVYGDDVDAFEEEMVADAVQMIIGDEAALKDFVTQLHKADRSLMQRIKEFLDAVIKTLDGLLNDNTYTEFAEEIAKDKEALKELRAEFAKALTEAGGIVKEADAVAKHEKASTKGGVKAYNEQTKMSKKEERDVHGRKNNNGTGDGSLQAVGNEKNRADDGGRNRAVRGEIVRGNRKRLESFAGLTEYERSRVSEIIALGLDTPEGRNIEKMIRSGDVYSYMYDAITNKGERYEVISELFPGIVDVASRVEEFLEYRVNKKKSPMPDKKTATKSRSVDSEGRAISKEQEVYFADTKARDKDGNILALYHGSKHGEFGVFDMYQGVWMTSEKGYAEEYADVEEFSDAHLYEVYANITNPVNIGELNAKLDTAWLNKVSAAMKLNSNENATLKEMAKEYMGSNRLWLTRSREFIKLALSKGFDGLQATEGGTKTFCAIERENQVKLATNKVPTGHENMKFSMKEPVEETKNLIAVHGIYEANLKKVLDIGGFAMPSIAIIKDNMDHSKYGKDHFTDSGKRRTFKQLHYPYTLENLVKAMKANQKERGESLWGATARGLHSVATPKYGSIADIKADSGRLQTMSEEEYQEKLDEIDGRINKVIEEVKATNEPHNSNPFWEADIISEVLIEAAQKGSANAVKATFAKEDYQITDELAREIYDMARAAGKLPTGYFEAKPQRAVGFDEVRAVVVPSTMDQATRSRLEGEGMNVIEYTAGDEESRKEALNSVPDVKFSVRDQKYMEAVENKDMETAEEMVLEAAKAAGYNSPILYHGTDQFGFTEIDFRKSDDHTSFFMVDSVGTAQSYAGTDRVRSIRGGLTEEELKDMEDDKYNEIFEESQKIYRCRGKYGEDIGYKCYDLAVEIAQGGIDADDASVELYEFCGEIFEEIYNELWDPDEFSFEEFEDERGGEFYAKVGVVDALMQEYAELMENIESTYGIYKLVANTDNFLEIDVEGRDWNDIRWESGEGRYNTTRSVAEYANSKGYNGVIFKNIYDHGRYGGDRKTATVYIAFDGKLVKSADTVTYDNEGNVIPLSERFNSEEKDIRFSLKKESVEANISSNDHWRAAYEGLLREFEVTKEPLKDKESARRVVRKFLKEIKSGYSEEVFLNRFIDLCNYGADMQSDSDYKDLVTAMTMLAEDALKESAELDMEMYNQYADLRAELRNGKIKVTADMMRDLEAQDRKYPDLRRENFSRVQMSSKDGGAIDTKYAAWAEEYPELFKLDQHTSQAELLLDVVAIRDSLDPIVKNPYFDQLSDYAESYAYELLGRMNDIALEKPTFADKYEAKLKKLRDENKEALRRVREQAKNEKELLRKKYADNAEARLEATKKKYEKRMDRKEYWRLRKLAEKDAKALAEWLKKPTDKNHVPKKFKESVETVLALIETERPDLRIRLQDFVAMKSGLTELYGDGQGIFLYREKDERVVDILDMFIQKYPNGANLDAMTASEMKYFRQLIASVKKACTDANKLHTSAREKTTVELSEEYINEAQKKKDAKETGIIRRINDFFGLEMLDANSFFKRIGGNVYSELWKGLRKGMDKKVLRWKEAIDFINELVDPKTVREWTDEPAKEFEIGGVKVYLSIPQIMSLSCLMRRSQGRQHIVGAEIATETGILRVRGGGFKAEVLEGDKVAKKEKPKVVEPTEEEVKAIIGSLTEEQARVAYAMQKFLSENVAAWGNETTMLMFGYERFGEANYFPIVSDKNFVNEQVTKTEDITPTLRSMGLTKNLNQYANNPVIIQDIFKVFANHVDQMSNYNAFVPSESDFNKFLNFKVKNKEGRVFSVKDEMDRIMGKGGVKYIKNLMNRLVTANGLSDDIDLGKMLLRNMKVASVAANLRVILQQPTAYFRALNYIDPKYLLNPAVFKKADLNDVYENAPIALWKNWGNYEMDTGKSMYDQIIAPTKVGWTKDMMLAGAGWMDKKTWLRLWNACLLEARSENPKATDEEVKSIAGERLGEIVDESQVVDSVLHRSQIMRRKGLYTQMVTSFLSEPTKTFNMASNALVEVVRNNTPENRKKFIRCYSTLIFSGIMTAFMASFADAFRDDDDEDEYLKKWLRAFAGDVSEAETAKEVVMARLNSNIGDNLNPLGMLPFLRDVWSSFQGYDVKRTDFAWLNDVLKNMNRWMKFIEGESEYTLQAMLLNTAGAWSKLTGLPVSSATRELKSIANMCVYHFAYGEPGEYTEAEFAYQKLGKAIGSEKNASYYIDRMLKAYMNGDRKLATKIYNEMIRAGIDNQKIDGKVESKMKSAMKDNPDVLEAANAMANGDVKTLEAMADKMMSLGFRESEVASAINSAYNAMDDTEEEMTYEEIDESYWGSGAKTVDDLMDNKMMFNAHKAGSTSNYDKIREKQIQAKMNDGKTRKEAENSVRTSMRNQYKAMYEKALEEGDSAAMKEARSGHREFGGKDSTLDKLH